MMALLFLNPGVFCSDGKYGVAKFWSNLRTGNVQVIASGHTPIFQYEDDSQWRLGKTCEPVYGITDEKVLKLKSFFDLWVYACKNSVKSVYYESEDPQEVQTEDSQGVKEQIEKDIMIVFNLLDIPEKHHKEDDYIVQKIRITNKNNKAIKYWFYSLPV
jgi:hypothetical protein